MADYTSFTLDEEPDAPTTAVGLDAPPMAAPATDYSGFQLDEEPDVSRANLKAAPPLPAVVEHDMLSRETGIPRSVIPGYEEEARGLSRVITSDLESIAKNAPRTHLMLQDAGNASLLQKSVRTMARVEQSQARLKENLRVNNMSVVEQIGHVLTNTDALEAGLVGGVAGAKTIASAASAYAKVDEVRNIQALRKSFDAIDAGKDPGVIDPRVRDYQLSKPEQRSALRAKLDATQERVRKAFDDQLAVVKGFQDAQKKLTPARVTEFSEVSSAVDLSDFAKYAFGQAAVYLLGSIASGAASTTVTGTPVPGLLGFGYTVGVGDIYEGLVAEGREMEDWRAGVGAVPYAGMDLIGIPARAMRPIADKAAKEYFRRKGVEVTGDVTQKFLKEASEQEVKALTREMEGGALAAVMKELPRGMAEEFVNEAGQEFFKDVAQKVGTDEAIFTGDALLNWFNAGMAGAFGGAPVSAASAGVRHVVGERAAKAQERRETQLQALQDAHTARMQFVQEQGTLEQWVDATKGDTLFQASPEAFVEKLAEVLTEDGAEQQVYLDLGEAETFFQSEDVPMTMDEFATAVSEVREQITQARELGGDLVLPASKVVAFLARNEKAAGLMERMRLSLDSSTQAQYDATVESVLGVGVQAGQEKDALTQRAEAHEERFTSQLRAAGFSRGYSKQYAAAVRAFYETQSQRLAGNEAALAVLERRLEGLSVQRGADERMVEQGELEQPGSPAFDAWFGSSKVVDEQGAPLVVYHNSVYGDFDAFEKGEQRKGVAGFGFYFTDREGSNVYAEHADRFKADSSFSGAPKRISTMPVYLAMNNPLYVDTQEALQPYVAAEPGSFGVGREVAGLKNTDMSAIQRAGYDGVVFSEYVRFAKDGSLIIGKTTGSKAHPVYVVFEPTQIKSAVGNRGTYDPADPSILNQEALKTVGEAPAPRADGRIELHHWSKTEGLTEIHPDKYGSNNAGAEVARAHQPGWVNRTYYGLEVDAAGGYQRERQNGNVHYTTSIEDGALYDLIRDPDGLRGEGMDVNHYEQAIKDAGYKGYWVDAPFVGRAAAVFEPLAPESVFVDELNQDVRPLPGLESRSPGPVPGAHAVLRDYAAKAGIEYTRAAEYVKVDEARAKRIAQAYEDMPHAPNDPEVRAAYRAMIEQTVAQYNTLIEHGFTFTPMKEGMEDPYPSPSMVLTDLRDNKHAFYYPTDFGFGSDATFDPTDNMLMEMTDIYIDGTQLRANDVFRIVHDFYGHAPEGALFRARGEENAWQTHARMYTGAARRAMTTETRGQNSWVNFGPHGEANKTATTMDTVFADQKMGLLPEWVSEEGMAPPLEDVTTLYQDAAFEVTEYDDPATVATTVAGMQEKLARFRNWKPQKTSGGKFRGVPEWVNDAAMPGRAFNKLHKLMKQLTREGVEGRRWYEDAADYVMAVTKGNVLYAEKFIQLLAIYSPQSTVWINTMQAVKAFNMWRDGVPRDEFRVRPFGQEGALTGDEAAKHVLYDNGAWGGRKTNSFYLNLMKEIISKATPSQVAAMHMDAELLAKVNDAVTVDMWVKRAMGYNSDSTTDDKGNGAYSVQEALLSRIAYELNEELEEGEAPWFPHQVQAALWTAIKARLENDAVRAEAERDSFKKGYITRGDDGKYKIPTAAAALTLHRLNWRRVGLKMGSDEVMREVQTAKLSFSDMLMRMTEDVTWEAAPSTSLMYPINSMPENAMVAYTQAARDMLQDEHGNDELAAALGVHLSWVQEGAGSFEGSISPNTISTLLPTKQAGAFSREEVTLYAAAIQYIFQQDAVPWFRADAQAKPEPFKVMAGDRTLSGGGQFTTWAEATEFLNTRREALVVAASEKLVKAQAALASKESPRNLERVVKAQAALASAQAAADELHVRGGDMARGVKLSFPSKPTQEQLDTLLTELQVQFGQDPGFTAMGNDVVVINFRSEGVPFLENDDEVFVGSLALVADRLGLGVGTFISEGEYGYEHDWNADSTGESILREGPLAGRPDLHERLRAWRAQATQLRADVEARPEAFDTDAAEIEYDQSGVEGLEGFYSALRRSMEEALPEKGKGTSLLQVVTSQQKKGKFKKDEIEHSGLVAFLEDAGSKVVTKEEVLRYLDAAAVTFDVKEMTRSAFGSGSVEDAWSSYVEAEVARWTAVQVSSLPEGKLPAWLASDVDDDSWVMYKGLLEEEPMFAEVSAQDPQVVEGYLHSDLMYDDDLRDAFDAEYNNTSYDNLVLGGEDAGENYREKLFTLPGNTYEHPHWQGVQGVVLHERLDDREDTEGNRVLLINELQSDLHQQARKARDAEIDRIAEEFVRSEGYITDEKLDRLREERKAASDAYKAARGIAGAYPSETSPEYLRKKEAAKLYSDYSMQLQAESKARAVAAAKEQVPAAFGYATQDREALDGMWELHAAVVERQQAAEAEGDFEEAARLRDEAQSHVDAIAAYRRVADARPQGAPFKGTNAWVLLGIKAALQDAVAGGYDKLAWTTGDQQLVIESLEEEKYGNGMRGFYDKMMPNVANKYLKPFGVKVSTTTIMAPDKNSLDPDELVPQEVHSIAITPAMRDVFESTGQPLFQGRKEGTSTFYRIQHAGYPLSVSWRSGIQDGSGTEDGTSAMSSLGALLSADRKGGFDSPRGDVEIVKFTGRLLGMGADGEPVVEPEKEMARWVHSDWDGLHRDLDAEDFAEGVEEEALASQGWSKTPVRIVEGVAQKALAQGRKEGARRGSIQFRGDQSIINIFEKNDPSTVLHELGHFFLQTQQAISETGAAPGEWQADYNALLAWLGSDGTFTVEQHEKFARTFEQYLRTGNAPSVRLKRAFQNFKRWLLTVYKSAKQLNADIDPTITDIMDRMLATDEEIEELTTNPTFALDQNFLSFLTAAERKSYLLRLTRQSETAREKLLAKALKEAERNATQEWKELREKALREVDEDIATRPVYQAIHFMQTGKLLGREFPEGMEVERVQINQGIAEQMFGAKALEGLPSGVLTKKGGAHPDAMADQFGFKSGAELILAMREATPRKQLREEEADALMVKRHGDMLHDGTIEQQALEAMESQDRTQVLVYEMQVLARKAGKPQAAREALQARAQEILADMPLGELLKSVQGFYRAEVKSAAQAGKHLARKSFELAAKAKQQQVLNHMLYREALAAKDRVAKDLKAFKKLSKPQVKGKVRIDEGYHQKIVQILDAYNLGGKLTDKTQDKLTKEALMRWAAEKETNDNAVFIVPEKLLQSQKTNWRELTLEEFTELSAVIENIEAQGRMLRTVLVDGKRVELEEVEKETSESILAKGKLAKWEPQPRETIPAMKRAVAQYFLMHTRARTLIKKLDGWEAFGAAYKYLLRGVDAAANERERRMKDIALHVEQLFADNYGGSLRSLSRLKEKVWVEQLGISLTREGLIAIALNMGNSDNANKLVGGYEKRGWTHNKVRAALEAHLTVEDLTLVNSAWEYIDSFWPEIAELEKRTTGVTPAKVPAEEFTLTLANGSVMDMRGGYYPLVADDQQSGAVVDKEAESMAQLMRTGRFATAQTARGHTKARVEHAGQPVRLDLQPFFGHLQQVVTDLTMREAVENAYKVLKTKGVREAVEDTAGLDTHKYLRWWLEDVARNNIESGEALTKGLDSLRAGVSVAVMGFKFTTVAVQLTGYSHSLVQLGPKYALKGFTKYFAGAARNPLRLVTGMQAVLDKSKTMRDRSTTFHRDVNDALRAMQKKGVIRGEIAKMGFYPIVKMQMQVDTMTWLGAYEKANDLYAAEFGQDLAGLEARATEYADAVVVETQGSGLMKDLAAVERGSVSETHRLMSVVRLFTVFQSYFLTKFNLAYERGAMKDLKKPADVAKLAYEYATMFIVEAVIGEMILDRLPDFGDGDDEEQAGWWLFKMAMNNISAQFVIAREIAGSMQGFGGSPAGLRGLESVGRALGQVGSAVEKFSEDEDINTYGLAKSVLSATGIVTKVPVEWFNQILRGMQQEEEKGNATLMDYLRYNKEHQ